jgi:hypothetical protein
MGLTRSPMKPSSKPMTRSPMLRGTSQLTRTPMARGTSRMKTRRRKLTPIQQSAREEDCTLRFWFCRNQRDTVVWCHSNRLADGKGMGLKANDQAGCYGCSLCHAYLDGGWASDPAMTYELVQERFEQARLESSAKLQHKGLVAQ